MHQLQQHILLQLATIEFPRYADLKPEEVDGNQFMYHLRKLMAMELVQKRSDGRYELTATGSIYVDDYSLTTLAPRIQPKIVTLIVCRDEQGRSLLYKRARQPFIGRMGFPYGKIHLGESLAQAADREFKEKTGLAAALVHAGDVYIATSHAGQLISHILGHVFVSSKIWTTANEQSWPKGCVWQSIKATDRDRYIPGVIELDEVVGRGAEQDRFFYEWRYEV